MVVRITPRGEELLREAYTHRAREQVAHLYAQRDRSVEGITRRLMGRGQQSLVQPEIEVPPVAEILRERIQMYCNRHHHFACKGLDQSISVVRLDA
jgi:hypothetical protein